MNVTTKPEIMLACGGWLNLEHPDPIKICINDISIALGNTCRFNGQIAKFYSVAEHSVVCSVVAEQCGRSPEEQFACLMHDAAEAYVGDVVTALKQRLYPQYQNFETVIESAIEIRFGLNFELHKPLIKSIDQAVLEAECAAFGRAIEGAEPSVKLSPEFWGPEQAAEEFLLRYVELRHSVC